MTKSEMAAGPPAAAGDLLQNIDRVVRWLPACESARTDLLAGVAEMERQLATTTLSRGLVLNFQVNVLRLRSSPLRTLLSRRVTQLGALCPHAAG